MLRLRRTCFAALVIAFALFATACSGSDSTAEGAATQPDAAATASADPVADEPTQVPPEPTPLPTEEPPQDLDVVPGALGTYLVARPGAGDAWQGSGPASRVLAVYDEPAGEKRMLVEFNAFDGVEMALPLFNWADAGSPTVLRVVEGGPGDQWARVQAPTRPHNTSVWVETANFRWASTTRRIEIDLSGPGQLTVLDGDEEIFQAPIVQGRESRPTPTHVTYLEAGLLGAVFGRSPAYGDQVLMMASFSEALGTFGGGGSPQNFVHGTNQPPLMGQQVSSGEIRLTNEDIAALTELVWPGTPIIIHRGEASRDLVLDTEVTPAPTIRHVVNAAFSPAAERQHPQLWTTCDEPALVCPNPEPERNFDTQSFRYATALDLDSAVQIPVFDEPDGEPRTLLDINEIDRTEAANPLFPTTAFGNPLVLRVLGEDGDYLKVQVPTRPNHSTAWVRRADFDVASTQVFVEISTKGTTRSFAGEIFVQDGAQLVFNSPIASGRDSRPTPNNVAGWVGQLEPGSDSQAFLGPWIIDLGIYSEAMGTFGPSDTVPLVVVHGTNVPEVIGQRVTSGALRLANDELERFRDIEGLTGAPVFIHDQAAYLTFEGALLYQTPTQPAATTEFDMDAKPLTFTPL